MKKKMVFVLVIFAVLGALVTGCEKAGDASDNNLSPNRQDGIAVSPSDNSLSPQGTEDEKEIVALSLIDKNISATLTITGMMNLDDMDVIIHQFNKEFPNVNVVKDVIQLSDTSTGNATAELRTKLNTKILSGQSGDIIVAGGSVGLFNPNILADLHEFIYNDSQFNKDDYFMNVIEAYSYNGGLYVMPLDNSVKLLGFSEPLTGNYDFTNKSDVWEFTHALDEAKNIADQNGLKGKNYINFTPDSHLFATVALPLNYAEFIDLEKGEVNIDCAEFVDMLKYIKGLADDGYTRSSQYAKSLPEGATVVSFGDTGRAAAMLFTYTNDNPDYQGIRPLTGKSGELNISNAKTLAINEHSANKQLAWEFIKCALSYEVQSSPNMVYPPINRTALSVYAEQRYLLEKSNVQRRNDSMNTSDYSMPDEGEGVRLYKDLLVSLNERVTKYTFTDFDIDEIIFEQVADYFEGKITAEETAQVLQRKISMVIEG